MTEKTKRSGYTKVPRTERTPVSVRRPLSNRKMRPLQTRTPSMTFLPRRTVSTVTDLPRLQKKRDVRSSDYGADARKPGFLSRFFKKDRLGAAAETSSPRRRFPVGPAPRGDLPGEPLDDQAECLFLGAEFDLGRPHLGSKPIDQRFVEITRHRVFEKIDQFGQWWPKLLIRKWNTPI